ncbi:3-oxoacyl-[acyl-carrier-protein] reductase [bacterium]|nr:3-oxoacyl-[acyl-carrier-protein] reductase [bacterium]
MEDFFKGRTAIVTGASRGIGYSIAQSLARIGVNLSLISTRLESVECVAVEFREKYGVKVLPVETDVKNYEAVVETVKRTQEELGEIDFLVNNAGITRDKLLIQMKVSDWDDVIDTNLKGSFHFAKGVCRAMMKNREGVILNITSVVGLMGNPGQANYSAAKAGIIGFTKTLARELAPRNIRVNAIAPGYICSDMTEKLPDRLKEELKSRIPLGEFGSVEDVANCVTFLLSPMARYITGAVIQVDGGLNM